MKSKKLLHITVILFTVMFAVQVTSVMAEDLNDSADYTITGYSFNYDAVSESESGLRLETSLFKPLMITSSTSDIFGSDPFTTSLTSPTSRSAPHGFAIAAEYLATPNLAFHGAIGVTDGQWNVDSNLEAESSWEANLGLVYKFYNSLSYEVHFGYMDTGDLFQEVDTYSEIESIIMVSNQLTLSF